MKKLFDGVHHHKPGSAAKCSALWCALLTVFIAPVSPAAKVEALSCAADVIELQIETVTIDGETISLDAYSGFNIDILSQGSFSEFSVRDAEQGHVHREAYSP